MYKDPIVQKILDKFEDEGPQELKGHYYNGDVTDVPKEELPVCSLAKDNLIVEPASNMEDEHRISLVANVIIDWTQDLNRDFNIVAGSQQLYDLMEGRNDDYTLKPTSLLYILRKYQKLDTNLWLSVGQGERVNGDYGLAEGRRGPGIFSLEGVLRFNAILHVERNTS